MSGRTDASTSSTTLALAIYSAFARLTVAVGLEKERPLTLLALLLIPALAALRERPALFAARWTSPGYRVAVLPIVGIALERDSLPRLVARRLSERGPGGVATGRVRTEDAVASRTSGS